MIKINISKLIKIIYWLFLFSKIASAVIINQVLYDPLSTESGGEAIELFNPDSFDADIGNLVIATETADKDAVIPEGTLLKSKGYYLIADQRWSTLRDNPDWKDADHEETITLGNKNAGVALKDSNGTIVDAVGWGDAGEIEDGLFEGEPALEVKAGSTLLRIQDTDNNIDDFREEHAPWFSDEDSIEINADVGANETIEEVFVEDDNTTLEGIQLKPYAGAVRTVKFVARVKEGTEDIFAEFLNQTIEMKKVNSTHFEGFVELDYFLAPDDYFIVFTAGENSKSIEFEYMSLLELSLDINKVKFNAKRGRENPAKNKAVARNNGNVKFRFSLNAKDLKFGQNIININNLRYSLDDGNYKKIADSRQDNKLILLPGEKKELSFSLFVPEGVVSGSYRTVVRVEVENG